MKTFKTNEAINYLLEFGFSVSRISEAGLPSQNNTDQLETTTVNLNHVNWSTVFVVQHDSAHMKSYLKSEPYSSAEIAVLAQLHHFTNLVNQIKPL